LLEAQTPIMRRCACPFVVVCCSALISAVAPIRASAQTAAPPVTQAHIPVPAPANDAPDGLRDLIGDTIADFRRLPSAETFSIVTLGGVGAAMARSWDGEVTLAMAGSSSLNTALKPGETLGGARAQIAAALGTYAIGRFAGSPAVTMIGADLIRSQIVAQTMTATIKLSVGRGRPDGTQYSFPSGHSSATFATATVLQRHLGWKAGIPAYGLAAYVAASRVQDKRHFLSDVTFGAAIGVVAGRSVTIGRGQGRVAVSPAAAPGGAAVQFTWLGRD
jgi:membrane-associated phospholipid phosphatase